MIRVYCDGIFDLFHAGHLKHLQQIHDYFSEPIHLIVGVISDDVATDYKRKPVICESDRLRIIDACVYTSSCFITNMLTITEQFMNAHCIDFVVHALTEKDKQIQSTFFEIPRQLNKFIELDYNTGISTTQIINNHYQPKYLQVEILPVSRTQSVLDILEHRIGLCNTNTVLEIGCEDELFARYVGNENYMCLDTNIYNVTRFLNASCYLALHFSPSIQLFAPKHFDYVIINTPCLGNISDTLDILEPVSNTCVYICNIIDDNDLKIEKQIFIDRGYTVVDNECIGGIGYDAFILCDQDTTNIF